MKLKQGPHFGKFLKERIISYPYELRCCFNLALRTYFYAEPFNLTTAQDNTSVSGRLVIHTQGHEVLPWAYYCQGKAYMLTDYDVVR